MILKYLAFPIDLISFQIWLKNQFSGFSGFAQRGSLELVFGPSGAPQLTEDQKTVIKNYYNSLTQSGEAAKLALPSRLSGAAKKAHNDLIGTVISALDFTALSAVQKKFMMGTTLTNDEYDSLPIS